MMSDERRLRSSCCRSFWIPIVTLSKSMRRAAFGAWWMALPNIPCVTACGPRWRGATGPRCVAAGRERREFMNFLDESGDSCVVVGRGRAPDLPPLHLPSPGVREGVEEEGGSKKAPAAI